MVFEGWQPGGAGHYCLEATVREEVAVAGQVGWVEVGHARTNFDIVESATASPASRELVDFEVSHPFEAPTRVTLGVIQPNPLYRVMLESTELWLAPGQRRTVRAWIEFAPDGSGLDPAARKACAERDGSLSIEARADVPGDEGWVVPLAGIQVLARTGRATRFEGLAADGKSVWGRVVTVGGGEEVGRGEVVVVGRAGGRQFDARCPVAGDGRFRLPLAVRHEAGAAIFFRPPRGFCSARAAVPGRR